MFHQASEQRPTSHIYEVPTEPSEVVLPGECLFHEIRKWRSAERAKGQHPELGALIFLALSILWFNFNGETGFVQLCSPKAKSHATPAKQMIKEQLQDAINRLSIFPWALELHQSCKNRKQPATQGWNQINQQHPSAGVEGLHAYVEKRNSVDGNASPVMLRCMSSSTDVWKWVHPSQPKRFSTCKMLLKD